MPEGTVDKINIEIEVRLQKLKEGMKSAKDLVGTTVNKINNVINNITGPAAPGGPFSPKKLAGIKSGFLAIAAAVAAVKIAVEGLAQNINLVQAGIALAAGDSRRFKDEMNDLADAFLATPFFGPLFGKVLSIGIELLGFGNLKDAERDLRRAELQAKRFRDELTIAQSVQVQNKVLESLKEIDLVKRESISLEARLLDLENQRRQAIEKHVAVIRLGGEDLTREERVERRRALERVGRRTNELFDIKNLQEIEKTRLRILSIRTDATQTFQSALGAATFGAGGGFGIEQSPTKQGQEKQTDLLTKTNQLLTQLIEVGKEGAFA